MTKNNKKQKKPILVSLLNQKTQKKQEETM